MPNNMITRIIVMGRYEFQRSMDKLELELKDSINPWYAISIYGCGEDAILTDTRIAKLASVGLNASLSMLFDDIDKLYETGQDLVLTLFSAEQARTIIGFLRIARHLPDGPLFIHCHAGISRSGAVGLFACRNLGLDETRFRQKNQQIYPNAFILSKLEEEAQKQKEERLTCPT